MTDIVRRTLTTIGTWTSHPAAFLIIAAYAALWAVFQRETLDWHGGATLATWLMTLFIQRAEHRDTQAIHAKLDELVRVSSKADDRLTTMDEKEPEDIEEERSDAKRG